MTRRAAFRSNSTVRNHTRGRHTIAPTNEAIEERLTELISPATFGLASHAGDYNLRESILRLPVMVALILTMVWRQVDSVRGLVGLLKREGVLWASRTTVSREAVAKRLRVFPAKVFADLFAELAPLFQARAAARSRPLPAVVQRAKAHFSAVLAADGTTLEELFHKVGLLREVPGTVLAGRLLAVLNVASKQPLAIIRQPESTGNDHWFQSKLFPYMEAGCLVLLDAGFYDFRFFAELTARSVAFIVRGKSNLTGTVLQTFQNGLVVRDVLMQIGAKSRPVALQTVRVVDIRRKNALYRFITNVLDPAILSAEDVVALYALRWRVEDAFLQVKRLLGLSFLWCGAENTIQLQIWATWLMYATLVDLCDAIAEELDLPLERISLEMVYRSLYFFCGAFQRGEATDPVIYLASKDQRDLGIVKTIRKKRPREPIDNLPTTLKF